MSIYLVLPPRTQKTFPPNFGGGASAPPGYRDRRSCLTLTLAKSDKDLAILAKFVCFLLFLFLSSSLFFFMFLFFRKLISSCLLLSSFSSFSCLYLSVFFRFFLLLLSLLSVSLLLVFASLRHLIPSASSSSA